MQWERTRDEFPILDHEIFMNSADQMAPARYWLDGFRDCLTMYEAGRVRDDPPYGPATHPFLTTAFQDCVDLGAELIGADPTEVTNMYRPMTAMNLILTDLLDWDGSENVVFTDLTYPSMPYILFGLRDHYGVELRRVESKDGVVSLNDLADAIDDDTQVVCINRTTPWCGFTFDVEEVADLAHEHDAYVLDDAMQSVGAMELDVHQDDVDFLVTGSYKWQCGPEGAGIFYIREDLIGEFDPDFRNYIWSDLPGGIPFSRPDHDNVEHWNYPLVENANRYEQGIVVTPVLFGWRETLEFLLDLGPANIEERITDLGGYLIDRLREIGCEVVTPSDPDRRHGLIVYTTGDDETDAETYERFEAPPPGKKPINVTNRSLGGVGGIRVSCHFFNTKADIDELVDRQQRILEA